MSSHPVLIFVYSFNCFRNWNCWNYSIDNKKFFFYRLCLFAYIPSVVKVNLSLVTCNSLTPLLKHHIFLSIWICKRYPVRSLRKHIPTTMSSHPVLIFVYSFNYFRNWNCWNYSIDNKKFFFYRLCLFAYMPSVVKVNLSLVTCNSLTSLLKHHIFLSIWDVSLFWDKWIWWCTNFFILRRKHFLHFSRSLLSAWSYFLVSFRLMALVKFSFSHQLVFCISELLFGKINLNVELGLALFSIFVVNLDGLKPAP